MRLSPKMMALAGCATAALLAFLAALSTADFIENRSRTDVRRALLDAGYVWADVRTDGLQVFVSGTAPSESQRFRALSTAGEAVDPGRVRDAMQVDDPDAFKAPDFSIEILRNDEGISLIGLVPARTDRTALIARLTTFAGEGTVTDLLDTADHPVPAAWDGALDFALAALERLPRSKVSVSADHVSIVAIADSAEEKAKIEAELVKSAPKGLTLGLDISAPRPVITPFTLRFVKDASGARFDACSADSEKTRSRILAAVAGAGVTGEPECVVGLGVPSPDWGDAAIMGIGAVRDMGTGTLTFSDADVSLVVPDTVDQATYDRLVGALESNLPDAFSLHAERTAAKTAGQKAERPEFKAELAEEGKVTLAGRVADLRTRDAVQNLARARFGNDRVYLTLRLDDTLPQGWPLRVLSAVEALDQLDRGTATVREDRLTINGISGKKDASDRIARLLSQKLGESARFDIAVQYDRKLDPLLGLPTAEQCAENLNAILAAKKISFEPGAATIAPDARDTLDRLAEAMKTCSDVPMEIGGHTDSQGGDQMNLDLSQNRAQAVIKALMERRILTRNLTAKGYGESVPISDNATEAGREANRRIEVRLVTPGKDQTSTSAATGGTAAAGPGVASLSTVVAASPGADTPRPKSNPRYPAVQGGGVTDSVQADGPSIPGGLAIDGSIGLDPGSGD